MRCLMLFTPALLRAQKFRGTILGLLFLIGAAALPAQTGAGRIQGTVKDTTGAVIPSTKVVAEHLDTGNRFGTETNQSGFFLFPSAQPGKYRITGESPGLEKWEGELQLLTGQEAVIELVMKVGGAATAITVAGDVTPLLTTTSATLSNVVERARIEELPLNGRFFQNLLPLTTPGLEAGRAGSGSPQPYGLRDGTVQFVQDGVSITNANVTAITSRPPGMDTIQEFRVLMSVPSAKYSSAVTAVLSTRSGTNQWHGGLFYTGRNNGFGVARQRQDFFTKPPQLIRNEYGASIGGPVRLPRLYNGKDRTFFFLAWEAFALRSGSTISTSMPTPAMRQGDFSQLTDNQSRPVTLYDPWSTAGAAENYSRVPFTGNIIPVARRSPFAAHFYGVLPEATQPGVNPSLAANWSGPDPTRQNDWTYTWRVDHRLNNSNQIFGRYTIGNRILYNRRGDTQTPITSDKLWNSQDVGERMQTGSLTWNRVFSPSFFVETVIAGSSLDWRFGLAEAASNQIVSDKLGVPNPFNISGAPIIDNIGWNLRGVGFIPRAENTKPVSGEQNYTLVRGKHQLEFGWRVQRMFLDVLPDRPGQASISFASQATGLYDRATGTAFNSLPRTGDNAANFFLGVAGTYSQTLPAPEYALRSTQASGYVQDNWRLTRGLTLNFGLRYDYFQPLIDQRGINAVFDFPNHAIARQASIDELVRDGATTQAFVNAFAAIGVKFETTKEAGLPDGLVNLSQRNFSPRVGFAYDLRAGKRSLVFRGGYGEYRFPLATRLFNVQRGNPPLQGTVSGNINSAAQSPDGQANWGLRSVPTVIMGTQSGTNAIRPDAANAVPRGVGINTFAPHLSASMAREWNLTFETEIMANTLFRVAYVGTAGRHLEQDVNANGQPSDYVHFVTTGLPLPTGPFASVARRNYDNTTYGLIRVYSTTGYSNFNGLQVEVQRRFSRGLGFQWFYVMSNALWVGSGNQILGQSSIVADPVTFLPGSVPTEFDALNRFLNYRRDPAIPKHRMNWNLLFDLPIGRGKAVLSGAGGIMNRLVGGWQIAAYSTMNSRYMSLPTDNWGAIGAVQTYGRQYAIEDCRSGTCFQGHLYYNGYIPANQINTLNAQGRPNGVMGVPANYRPASQPIWPTPATPNPSDPNSSLYGTNLVFVPMKNGAQQRIAYDTGLHPWRNQLIPAPWEFQVTGSLFKVIPINERFQLRLNLDAFNVFNMPGSPMPDSATGILSLRNSNNQPRQLQITMRLNW